MSSCASSPPVPCCSRSPAARRASCSGSTWWSRSGAPSCPEAARSPRSRRARRSSPPATSHPRPRGTGRRSCSGGIGRASASGIRVHGRDVGYFIFSLPFERAVSAFLLGLLAVTVLYVVVVYRAGGAIRLRPLRVTREAQVHLVRLAAVFLLVVAWRVRIERYVLELGQPSPDDPNSFAGAGYLDTHVRSPLLEAGSIVAVVLALACCTAPHVTRRRATIMIAVPAGVALGADGRRGDRAPDRAAVRRGAERTVARVAVPRPLDRRDESRARARRDRRAGICADRHGLPGRGRARSQPAREGRDMGHEPPAREGASARDRHAVLRSGTADPRRPAAPVDAGEPARARPPLRPRAGRRLGQQAPRLHPWTRRDPVLRDRHRVQPPAPRAGLRPRAVPAADLLRKPSARRSEAGAAQRGVAVGRRQHPSSRGRHPAGRTYHYDGTGGVALSNWIRRAVFALGSRTRRCCSPRSITPGRGSSCTATCTTACGRWRRSSSGTPSAVPLDAERPDRLRRRRLHDERRLPVRRARRARAALASTTRARRCPPRSTRSRGRSPST